MGKTIVITNRKGGCGKTVTAANLGVGLARGTNGDSGNITITGSTVKAIEGSRTTPSAGAAGIGSSGVTDSGSYNYGDTS